MNDALTEKLENLPTRPGVYQHRDAAGSVLYVGKAKNLRARVRSYFQDRRPVDGRLRIMINKIADFEIIVTDSEAEALILENNLIKKLRPRYNINLKDDKTYPYIVIKNERFPRVFPTRKVRKDGSRYFGPYTNVKVIKQVLKTVRTIFKLRSCSLHLSQKNIDGGKFQPCLDYYIKKCAAPCIGLQTEESYNKTIKQIEKLLNGHTQELLDQLRQEMKAASADMRFEEAGHLRDQIRALERYSASQKMVSQDKTDRDLFAMALSTDGKLGIGVMFKVREGKIIGRQHKQLRRIDGVPRPEVLQRFLESHYSETTFFPDEVLLSEEMADAEPLAELLRQKRSKKVVIRVPERGEKAELLRMAVKNARLLLEELIVQQQKHADDRIPRSVKSLQRDLHLPRLPRRIECFDISHLGGTETVASCVVFEDGAPKKSEYRKYKIRTAEGRPDDFQSMREVIGRRYRRMLEENGTVPDLIVIDGGKGQLSSAVQVLNEIGFGEKSTVIGLAKRLEEVFRPGDPDPILIPKTSSSLRLLQRIRNEAHRFAVTYQRTRRGSTTLRSAVTDIPGVGQKSAQKLLKHFGSVKKLGEASEAEIAALVGKAMARRVTGHFGSANTTEQGD